jgi:hypothetical protein
MPRLDAATLPARRPVPAPLFALFALVLILAAVGAYLAAGVVGGGSDTDPVTAAVKKQREPKGGWSIGDSVFTSFGAVAVEAVEKGPGPTAKALSGVTHGVKNLVPPNKVQINAFATMTNLTGKTVEYSPAQFSLLVGSKDADPLPLSTASIKPGVLQPSAAIDVRLSFVVPRKGQKLWVRYKDPARAKPFLIDLGRVTKTPQSTLINPHEHKNR